MELMTQEIRERIPKLYEQEGKGDEAIVYVKYFHPCSQWTWYATEFDGEDSFFGIVRGHVVELGYFSLSELQEFKNSMGLGIERDLHFKPTPLGKVREILESGGIA